MAENNSLSRVLHNVELDNEINDDATDVEVVFIPPGGNQNSDDENSDDDNCDEVDIAGGSFEYDLDKYDSRMKLLEPDHVYRWIEGEYPCDQSSSSIKEEIFLSTEQKTKVANMNFVDIFELFFCSKIKKYILEATAANDYNLSAEKFDAFLGILITTIVNSRKHERDYWSSNTMLHHKRIAAVMTRDEFLKIKNKLKLSKSSDFDSKDRVWKIRKVFELLRKNLKQFGYFSSILSIDESMIKFFGRSIIKQFMRNKPIKFGLKMWCIATVSGYVLDIDVYCGKGGKSQSEKFENLNLGTRVVMMMLNDFLANTPKDKLQDYHVAFDNFFTSPDLLVHLKKLGLKATGTVRQNRVYEFVTKVNKKGKEVDTKVTVPISIDKKADRGTREAKHDEVSKINYVSVKDSKVVSVLSSEAGITPEIAVKRYSATENKKVEIQFPQAIKLYNKSMGGVDLYDQHCGDLSIKINSKKWTFAFLKRMIETSLSNATVIYNICTTEEKKKSTYDFALDIAEYYLDKSTNYRDHNIINLGESIVRVCSKCYKRTSYHCLECTKHFCKECFVQLHNNHTSEIRTKRKTCFNDKCDQRTQKFCKKCLNYICKNCFDGSFHRNIIKNGK